MSGSINPTHKVLTRAVAYLDPLSLGLYRQTVSLSPGPCSLSELSSLTAPTDPRVIQAPVEQVFEAVQLMRSLVPETACGVHLLLFRSRGTLPALVAFAAGMCSELVPLEVDLSVVVESVGIVAFVAAIVVAVAVAFGSGGIDGPSRSVTSQCTPVGSFGLWWGSVTATPRGLTG